MNSMACADIDPPMASRASTIASTLQQMSLSLGLSREGPREASGSRTLFMTRGLRKRVPRQFRQFRNGTATGNDRADF